MIVGVKDAAKLIGISLMTFCAVLVCGMFLNFNIDITAVEGQITSQQGMVLYEAQQSMAVMVSSLSGGCLLATTVVMLISYIKHYIDTHKKELGIMKALGYSNLSIAKHFWVFGISVLIGTGAGFAGSFAIMPLFYDVQNEKKLLPEITINFHPSLLIFLVIVPTVMFAFLAVVYALIKLKTPVLRLIRDDVTTKRRKKKYKESKRSDRSFIGDLKSSTLRGRKSLVFFIIFASFCFSSMTQMAFNMKDLANVLMAGMILVIGLVLAFVTLLLAVTTIVNGNTKTIALMRVTGYAHKDCCRALLGGYRPLSYIGFALGTGYQYLLMRVAVDVVFKEMEGVPEFSFDVPIMLASLAVFIIVYEVTMYIFAGRIKRVPIKQIMSE